MNKKEFTVAFSFENTQRKFLPEVKDFQDLQRLEAKRLYPCCSDDDGNALPDDEWAVYDIDGNILIQGRENIESPVGELCFTSSVDECVVKYVEECDKDELRMIYDAYRYGYFINQEVVEYIESKLF